MKLFSRYIYHTMFGLAQIFETKAPDASSVRVLQLGKVWQSATYLDERRFEPVFAYYRSFDRALRGNTYPPVATRVQEAGITATSPTSPSEKSPTYNTLLPEDIRAIHPTASKKESSGQTKSLATLQTPRPSHRNDVPTSSLQVLMLGGGGFAWPKHVLATYPNISIDVIEIDPTIIRIAQAHFFLDEAIQRFDPTHTRLHVFCLDGREYLDTTWHERDHKHSRTTAQEQRTTKMPSASASSNAALYDVIVNDAFSGAQATRTLVTVEAIQAAKMHLKTNGIYVANVVSTENRRNLTFLRDFAASARSVFDYVHIMLCPDDGFGGEDNYLIIATDAADRFPDAIPYSEDFLGTPMHD